MMADPWKNIQRAFELRKGVKLTFEQVAVMVAGREKNKTCVGGTAADRCLGSILLAAMKFTEDRKVLVGIGCLVTSDVLVDLCEESDKNYLIKSRQAMISAGVYPAFCGEEHAVVDVIDWLSLLKSSGKDPPFQPISDEFIQAMFRIVKKRPRLFGITQ